MRRLAIIVGVLLLAPQAAAAQQPQQAVSSQLVSLHDDLRLSAGQETAWRTYTLAIAPSPDAQARHRSAAELMPLEPTPRRIALIEANIAADQIEFRRQAAAAVAFYDQLTPAQQRIFDRETLPSPGTAAPGSPSGAPPQN